MNHSSQAIHGKKKKKKSSDFADKNESDKDECPYTNEQNHGGACKETDSKWPKYFFKFALKEIPKSETSAIVFMPS